MALPAAASARVAAGHTLDVRGLSTHFTSGAGVVRAVDDVSFAVGRGKVMGLVGESGSGKSATGFSILGLVDAPGRVVAGQIMFEGQDIARLRDPDMRRLRGKRIAMVFQDPMMTLNPVLRIDTQMIEVVQAHEDVPRADARARARDALGLVGISSSEERLRAYLHQFSGGQRQRIGIARALAVQPEFLVCDEAVAALDVPIQAQILNLFMDLRRDLDLTNLFISHDLGVVEHLSDRVAIMYLGRIVEQAGAEYVFVRPSHPYTQALLAEAPRLDARARRFTAMEGEIPSPLHPPAGCHFHPRCPHAFARCASEAPALKQVAPGHSSACHLNGG